MLIASILFSIVIHKVMTISDTSIECLLAHYPFGNVILIIIELFLLVLYSSMLSASGEIIYTIFSIKKIYGVIISALITLIIIRKGYSCVMDFSQILFIPIVIIIFIIGITTTEKSIAIPPSVIISPKAIIAPIVYVSYNMLTTIPLLISIPDKYLYKNCSNQVGIVIFLLSATLMLPMYTHYSVIAKSPLPFMAILDGIPRYLYLVFICLAIMTTAVSTAYSLCLSANILSYSKSTVIYTLVAVAVSALGFTNIVNSVYFIFGTAGILILIIILRQK